MSDTLTVPATITQEMADCIGCTPEQYASIVRAACLFVEPRLPFKVESVTSLPIKHCPHGAQGFCPLCAGQNVSSEVSNESKP